MFLKLSRSEKDKIAIFHSDTERILKAAFEINIKWLVKSSKNIKIKAEECFILVLFKMAQN